MQTARFVLKVVCVVAIIAVATPAVAQDGSPGGNMPDRAAAEIEGMKVVLTDVLQLLEKTREEEKDLLKLNCINEKLAAIKGFLKVSEQSMTKMQDALARNDAESAQHQFALINIAADKVDNLGVEAQSCAGEILRYAGDTEVIKDIDPAIADLDPTVIVDESDDLFRLPEGTPFQ